MFNIVLDIDDTLVSHRCKISHVALEVYGDTYYLLPGCKTFLQVLFANPLFKVSFYSAGIKARNEELVEKLLTYSLGKEEYKKIRDSVLILSRDDACPSTVLGPKVHYEKDLAKAIESESQLPDTILLDDSFTSSYLLQRKNLLKLPGLDIDTSRLGRPITIEDIQLQLTFYSKQLFYALGLLYKSIEITIIEKRSLSEVIWNLQTIGGREDALTGSQLLVSTGEIYDKALDIMRYHDQEISLPELVYSPIEDIEVAEDIAALRQRLGLK